MNFKKLINDDNRIELIGLLTILVLLWLILYFIPELIHSIFNTFLGNLILVTITLLIMMYDVRYGIIIGIILIVIYRFFQLSGNNLRENFTWNQDSENNFLELQQTIHRNKVFDTDLIKNQASQEEVDYFNNNAMWPWSQKTIDLYTESIKRNPYIRTYSGDAVNYARRLYNEAAILRIISEQTKEGQFLLNGILVNDPSGNNMESLPSGYGEFAYKSGLLENKSADVIKCDMSNNNGAVLERIRYTGKGATYGEQTATVTPVDYNLLEYIIPGFKFLNKPCNPCVAMNEVPDYSCPFKLSLKNQSAFVSDVWQYLWNVDDNPLKSAPSFLDENINPDDFPLLSELQTELQKQSTTDTTDTTNTTDTQS